MRLDYFFKALSKGRSKVGGRDGRKPRPHSCVVALRVAKAVVKSTPWRYPALPYSGLPNVIENKYLVGMAVNKLNRLRQMTLKY